MGVPTLDSGRSIYFRRECTWFLKVSLRNARCSYLADEDQDFFAESTPVSSLVAFVR